MNCFYQNKNVIIFLISYIFDLKQYVFNTHKFTVTSIFIKIIEAFGINIV